jgi:hypothetical protein
MVGVYLGVRTFTDGARTYTVDLVGYRQRDAATAIGPGHSGHSPTGAGGSALGPLLFSVNRSATGRERTEELAAMSAATGIDLVAEGFTSVDQSLHLTPADYARFVPILTA